MYLNTAELLPHKQLTRQLSDIVEESHETDSLQCTTEPSECACTVPEWEDEDTSDYDQCEFECEYEYDEWGQYEECSEGTDVLIHPSAVYDAECDCWILNDCDQMEQDEPVWLDEYSCDMEAELITHSRLRHRVLFHHNLPNHTELRKDNKYTVSAPLVQHLTVTQQTQLRSLPRSVLSRFHTRPACTKARSGRRAASPSARMHTFDVPSYAHFPDPFAPYYAERKRRENAELQAAWYKQVYAQGKQDKKGASVRKQAQLGNKKQQREQQRRRSPKREKVSTAPLAQQNCNNAKWLKVLQARASKKQQQQQPMPRTTPGRLTCSADPRPSRSAARTNAQKLSQQRFTKPRASSPISSACFSTTASALASANCFTPALTKSESISRSYHDWIHQFYQRNQSTIYSSLDPLRGTMTKQVHLAPVSAEVQERFMSIVHAHRYKHSLVTFHGTHQANISSICQRGLLVPGKNGNNVRMKHGKCYGVGVYSSKTAGYSLGYVQGYSQHAIHAHATGATSAISSDNCKFPNQMFVCAVLHNAAAAPKTIAKQCRRGRFKPGSAAAVRGQPYNPSPVKFFNNIVVCSDERLIVPAFLMDFVPAPVGAQVKTSMKSVTVPAAEERIIRPSSGKLELCLLRKHMRKQATRAIRCDRQHQTHMRIQL